MLDSTNFLKITAVGASFFAAGGISTVSMLNIPCVLMSPPELAVAQWKRIYVPGKIFYPAVCAVSAASYIGLGFKFEEKFKLFSACAALTIGVLPYTGLTMLHINNYLMAVKDFEAEKVKIMDHIRTWGNRNFIRTFLPLSAALVGFYNILFL